jgi:hypothetical protein
MLPARRGGVPMSVFKRAGGLAIVAIACFLSVATTDPGPGTGECGGELLDENGGLPGDPCIDRGDCNEVCCECDDGETLFIARGCDFGSETCLSENELCGQALDDDPSLCE